MATRIESRPRRPGLLKGRRQFFSFGSAAAGAIGARRSLLAFKLISAEPHNDGKEYQQDDQAQTQQFGCF